MDYQKEYSRWRNWPGLDAETKQDLAGMTPEQVEDAFYRDLAFGTGGLRGVIGTGTNRMNVYTVAKASQGLADYLKKQSSQPSVAIG